MFHKDCYQILLLNFRSSAETHKLILPRKCFSALGGGGGGVLHNNVSQILATVNFSRGEIDGKFLSVWKNFIGNINLGQTSPRRPLEGPKYRNLK